MIAFDEQPIGFVRVDAALVIVSANNAAVELDSRLACGVNLTRLYDELQDPGIAEWFTARTGSIGFDLTLARGDMLSVQVWPDGDDGCNWMLSKKVSGAVVNANISDNNAFAVDGLKTAEETAIKLNEEKRRELLVQAAEQGSLSA